MERNGIERDGWIAAAAGLALAALVFLVPFLTYVFSYMITLVHEMGHAFFGWLYGYPSIPAFDFRYGGGVTSHQERVTILALGVQGVLVLAIYVFRHNPVSRALALSICAAYAWTAWTSLHHMVTTAMGHGAELVFAAIFFHRALSGRACQTSAERPLYAFLGFFITFYDVRFAHRLLTSSFHRKLYGQAKGGGHWMDFSRLAEEYLHVSLETVALVFLFLCIVPPILAFGVNHYRRQASALAMELRRVG
jgi:hypothetical protein